MYKKCYKSSIVVAVAIFAVFFVLVTLNLIGPITAHAFSSPAAVTLGTAGNFVILAETGITNTGGHDTQIVGDIGNSPGTASQMDDVWCSEITGTIYGVDATYTGSGVTTCFAGNPGVPPVVPADANKTLVDNAVNDMVTVAYTDAAGRSPDESDRLAGSIGGETFTTGVYKWNSDVNIATNITLSGSASDVWIFQITGDLDVASKGSVASGVKVLLTGGAKPSNVFWQVGGVTSATLGTYSTFNGTILSAKQVVMQTGAVLNGRALAQSLVTLDANVIGTIAQLTVNKVIINDNSGTKVISDFPLFIDGSSVTSGVASTTVPGTHTVSETSDPGYTATIGGDCGTDGTIILAAGENKTCTITNNDVVPYHAGSGPNPWPIPPLIDVVKVPSPLALPNGPGPVTYTYTLHNIGTIPIANITMADSTCSPIGLVFGDINANDRLDVDETWTYNCFETLTETNTNTITATGWGWEGGSVNGISATDIANATVVVGVPVVPPLIHVTKVPDSLVLSAGDGAVTYTYKVTNPGTVELSNVYLTDDKCYPVEYIFGDTNNNSKLDVTEAWTYTCSVKLTKTTVNTVTASGDANDLTAKDLAIATVVVAVVPGLPNTGLSPSASNVIVLAGFFAVLSIFYLVRRKQTA